MVLVFLNIYAMVITFKSHPWMTSFNDDVLKSSGGG